MKLFKDYIKNFDLDNTMIKRKYHHSFRVQTLSEMIAKSLGFNDRDYYLVSICGLFHDIARFKQAKEYNSFKDSDSFDHGDEGEIIFNEYFANRLNLSDDEINLILKSIRYHNKLAIGNDVNDKELLFCKLVRDADKIDVLYQIANDKSLLEEIDGDINESLHKEFFNKKTLNIKNITNGTEKNLLTLAYYWDINFDLSKKIICENRYYNKIEKLLNDKRYDEYFKLIYREMEEIKC